MVKKRSTPGQHLSQSSAAPATAAQRFAPHAVRGAALWVLAGAATKAASGLPSDLPSIIERLDLDPTTVLVSAVLVESAVAILALGAPRLARVPLAALLTLFLAILADHMASTSESCGCFGGARVPASVMFGADLVALALVVWTFWQAPIAATRLRVLLTVTLAVVLATSVAYFTQRRVEHALVGVQPTTVEPPTETTKEGWHPPTSIPEQVILRPLQWIGKPIADTPLGTWVDTRAFPPKARLIFFYRSCNHCADLLTTLAHEQASAPDTAPIYVLVQLPTPSAYKGRLFVDRVPTHALWVELPATVKAYVMTPPWIVDVEDSRVVRAERVPWPGEKDAKSAAPK